MDNALPISLVGSEQPKKVKKFYKVIKSDICVSGKFIPEGSIIDFYDESLSEYLTPAYPASGTSLIANNEVHKKVTVWQDPATGSLKRKRGRPRKLENIIEVAI